jgi:integrase
MAGQIIKRSKNSFTVRIFIGRDSKTGQRQYLNETVKGNKKKAEQVLTSLLHKRDLGELASDKKMTVQEYLEHWLETAARPKLTARTFDDYQYVLGRYIFPKLGNRKLAKLTPVEIQSVYSNMLLAKDRGGLGLKSRSVIYTHRIFSSALKQAVKWRILSNNPCQLVDLPKRDKTQMKAMSSDEVEKFLIEAKKDPYYVIFALMLGTGLRPGEVLALKWEDFSPATGNLNIQRALENVRGKISFKVPKTPRSRRNIKLPEHLVKLLLDHKDSLPFQSNLVFPSANDTPINERNLINRHFIPILKRAELSYFRLYDLRHTHATLLLKAGVHPKIVSERLGHSSITLTLDTYSHVLPGMQDEAADKLNAMLFKPEIHEEGVRAIN